MSHACGGTRVWDLLRGGRVKILMYHGVPTRERFDGVENYWRYNVPLKEFRGQVTHLAKRCNVISLADFLEGKGLSTSRTNVVITFDDGYGNNYTNAWPVLKELGLPALFAITTGFVMDRQPLWNDVVEYAVQNSPLSNLTLTWKGEDVSFDLTHDAGRVALNNWALRTAVTVDQEDRAPFLELLIQSLQVDASAEQVFSNEDYRPMTPEQVHELSQQDGVEIASHSVHHFLLAKLERDEMRAELRDSKARLEATTGQSCTSLCMPGGSYDAAVLEEAREAGYTSVLTSDVGPATASAPTLNRYGVFSRESVAWFADEIHGPVLPLVRATARAKHNLRTRAKSWRAS